MRIRLMGLGLLVDIELEATLQFGSTGDGAS